MSKVRVSFLLDTEPLDITPDAEGITKGLLNPARARYNATIASVQADADMADDIRLERLAAAMRGVMLSLMAEANLIVEPVPATTVVEMELPFEKREAR